MSLGEACLRLMDRSPNRIVQISADTGINYSNLDIKKRAIRTAKFLQQQGLQQGDVFGIIARNSANLAPIAVAGFITGMPFNALDAFCVKSDIVHMYGITKPKIIFCDEICYETVQSALDELHSGAKICIVDGRVQGVSHVVDFMEAADDSWIDFECPVLENPSKLPAIIMSSSGTTGRPKAVVLSQASLILAASEVFTNDEDISLNFITLYWFTGIWSLAVGLLNGTVRIITAEKLSSTLILDTIEKYKVTYYSSPTPFLAMILRDPRINAQRLRSVRYYLCGGARLPKCLRSKMDSFLENGKVFDNYGLTEAGNTVIEDNVIVDNISIRIVDESGRSLDAGHEGEILVHSSHSFLEYMNDPEQTAATKDAEGWIRTGDLGYLDADGRLFVVDRKKDILKHHGFHYSPIEIESVILELPEVIEVCACGVVEIESGDLPAALVVRVKSSTLTEQDIFDHVAGRLEHYKHLYGGVFFVDSIPKTATVKYQRNKVKVICTEFYNRKRMNSALSKSYGSY